MGLKVAFIGQKGFPARWGGIERHVEEVASRLARRGHHVTVYSRPWYAGKAAAPPVPNLEVASRRSIPTKHLDAISHSLACSLDVLFRDHDIVHYHAIGPASCSWLPRLRGKRVVVTLHSYDYRGAKWGPLARACLRISEQIALRCADAVIVVSKHQQRHYAGLGFAPVHIPSGVSVPSFPGTDLLDGLGLAPQRYVLFVGRLVPEKRPDLLIDAFRRTAAADLRLVLAGGSSASQGYVQSLHARAEQDTRILFPGYVKGRLLDQMLANCGLFVLPSDLEGLPLSLMEAMSHGVTCLASDIPAHRELISDGTHGLLFRSGETDHLAELMHTCLADPYLETTRQRLGQEARARVQRDFNWERVVDRIEETYAGMLASGRLQETRALQ